jgi:hypothetical protein
MSVNKSIFVDLEINLENLLENPKQFASEVYEAADKLCGVLNHNSSMSEARKTAKKNAALDRVAQQLAKEQYTDEFEKILNYSEEVELHVLFHLIANMKELVRDLELTLDSRATSEMIMNSPTHTDKRLAHEQYKVLRDSFENYRSFINLVIDDKISLVPLKPKTGNYGGTVKRSYPAYRINGDVYHNYRVVARMAGIKTEVASHMDLQELLTDEMGVQVIEVQL